MGKEIFELGVKLSRKRFVVTHDQGRLINPLNQVRHRKRFPRTRDT